MSNVIVLKGNEVPMEWLQKDVWQINDTPLANAREEYAFKRNSKYDTIDFSIIQEAIVKEELKSYFWQLVRKSEIDVSVRNFKEKVIPQFIGLLTTLSKNNLIGSLLTVDYRNFKENIADDDRQSRLFREIQLQLLSIQHFRKEHDVWDILRTPMNETGDFDDYATYEGRIINFSPIQNENLKKELKEYLYAYVTKEYKQYGRETPFMHHLLQFQLILRAYSKTCYTTTKELSENELALFVRQEGKVKVPYYLTMLEKINNFTGNKESLSFFDRDRWDIRELGISKERTNGTRVVNYIAFADIRNEDNKRLLKVYIKHLLMNTQLAVATIKTRTTTLKAILKQMERHSITKLQKKDAAWIKELIPDSDREYSVATAFNKWMEYLVRVHEISPQVGMDFLDKEGLNSKRVAFQDRLVETDTIGTMFNLLEKENENEYLDTILTILTYCGLRMSEMCNLKMHCTYTFHDGSKRMKYWSIKMRKEIDVPITENVYNKIAIQQKKTKEKEGTNKEFLFPSKGTSQSKKVCNKPISTSYASRMFAEFCKRHEIQSSEGNYQFKAHDFRHAYATYLAENNVHVMVIQELLGHESSQMTLAYLDKKQEREKKAIEKEVRDKGLYDDTASIIEGQKVQRLEFDENIEAIYIKKHLNYQTLPNGTCALPISQKCPHPNACLSCKSFATTKDNLPTLKRQLKRTERMIQLSEQRGFVQQMKTNQEVKKKLEYFIGEIENGRDFVQAPSVGDKT